MGVEKYHHYVADGIVTHNCFYGWKEGAAHRFTGKPAVLERTGESPIPMKPREENMR
jgi:hypothetical protein